MKLASWASLRRFIWRYTLVGPIVGGYHKPYLAPPSRFPPSYLDYVKQRPLVFGTWVQMRRIFFLMAGNLRKRTFTLASPATAHVTDNALTYNKSHSWGIQRERTERLMNVLRSIPALDTKNSKVLCIGPRNEAEILLLTTYGFRLKNIKSIDLFTYSPLIDVMDMHDMQFGDSQFDIVYSAYTLTYSDDLPRACSEVVRVCKDGGLMAIASVFPHLDAPQIGTLLPGGLENFFGYFTGHIKHIYWQEESQPGTDTLRGSTIFRICK